MDIKLLIVGSDNLFRTRLVERLRNEEIEVDLAEADCRTDIKKIIKKKSIDVIVIDLLELKRDGLMILETIRKSKIKAEVLLMNSSDQIALSIEGMKLGAFNDYLLPLDFDLFLSGIQEAAHTKKQKEKRPLLKKYQDVMAAVSFAEVGEHKMAKQFLDDAKRKKSTNKCDGSTIIK